MGFGSPPRACMINLRGHKMINGIQKKKNIFCYSNLDIMPIFASLLWNTERFSLSGLRQLFRWPAEGGLEEKMKLLIAHRHIQPVRRSLKQTLLHLKESPSKKVWKHCLIRGVWVKSCCSLNFWRGVSLNILKRLEMANNNFNHFHFIQQHR